MTAVHVKHACFAAADASAAAVQVAVQSVGVSHQLKGIAWPLRWLRPRAFSGSDMARGWPATIPVAGARKVATGAPPLWADADATTLTVMPLECNALTTM